MSDDVFDQAISGALARLSGGKAPSAIRSLARFAAQILSMRADGTADLVTDDESVAGAGGLGGRPLLAGLPGVRLDPAGTVRGRVAFEGGSFAAGEVVGYEQDRSADRAAARRGDSVPCGTIQIRQANTSIGEPAGIYVTFTPAKSPFDPIPALPVILHLGGAIALTAITPGTTPVTLELLGWIATGSPEVALRRLDAEEIP